MWFPTAGRVPRILCACAIVATFTADGRAQSAADKYPDKPIKIIVPFAPGGTMILIGLIIVPVAPGGSTDIIARVIGQKMTENWGQTVVVETRPGAGGRRQ